MCIYIYKYIIYYYLFSIYRQIFCVCHVARAVMVSCASCEVCNDLTPVRIPGSATPSPSPESCFVPRIIVVVPAGQALHTRAPISFWYEPELQNRQYWYFVSCARAILNVLVSRFMISPFVAFPFIQFLFMTRLRNCLESFWLGRWFLCLSKNKKNQ